MSISRDFNLFQSNLFLKLFRNGSNLLTTVTIFLFFMTLPMQLGSYIFHDGAFASGIRVDYLAWSIFISDITSIGLIILYFRRVIAFCIQPRVIVITGFLLIPAVISFEQVVSVVTFLEYLQWCVLFGIFVSMQGEEKQRILVLFITATIFLASIQLFLSIQQLIYKQSLQGVFYWLGERSLSLSQFNIAKGYLAGEEFLRPYGTFSHPNSMAGFYGLVFTFFLTYKPFHSLQVLRTIGLFLCFALVLISFSKTAIIATFIIIITYQFKQLQNIDCMLCVLSRIVVIAVVGIIFLSAQGDPATLEKRYILATVAIQMIVDYPINGVGLGNYILAQQNYSIDIVGLFTQPVHTIFLLFFAETGLVVGGAMLTLTLKWMWQYLQNKAFLLVLIFIGITGMLDHYWLTLQQNMLISAVITGLVVKD